jgi:hypothetical protein
MPFSGKLVTRFGSYRIVLVALLFYVLSLTNLGFVTEIWQLVLVAVVWIVWKPLQY